MLGAHLPITGCCPVREGARKRIKYFVVFASRHPDAMLLLNDIMLDAYKEHLYRAEFSKTLLADLDWRDWQAPPGLEELILSEMESVGRCTRDALWLRVIQRQFM